jgi:hypothetical protein
MPSILNSDDGVVSGTSGLKTTGGNDGITVFQSNGTETARINTDKQIVAAAGTASLPIYSTTGDLNTGIYFPSADTIGFAEGGAQCGEFDSSANFKFNSGYGSVATAYGCRAWVNFKGTDTVTIRASGNVSSITDNGLGQYTVNFTTAIIDSAYCTQYSCTSNDDTGFTAGGGRQFAMIRLGTTTSVQVQCIDDGGGLADSITNHVAVFR